MGLGIWAPLSYLLFLGGSLFLFSKFYRKKQADAIIYTPWFPPNKSRDLYISLLSLNPPPPRPLLIAALLRRAMYSITQIIVTRDSKAALSLLLAKGQIGDELWERFLAAEKELEIEIVEVCEEAETWMVGYGKIIFGVAADMIAHEGIKKAFEDIEGKRNIEKAKLTTPASNHIFAPLSYLTPSSLTLFPSNPIPTVILPSASPVAPLTPSLAPAPSIPVSTKSPHIVTPPSVKVIASSVPSPKRPLATSPVVVEAKATSEEMEDNDEGDDNDPDDSGTGGGPSKIINPDATPGSSKKKKNKKKKKAAGSSVA